MTTKDNKKIVIDPKAKLKEEIADKLKSISPDVTEIDKARAIIRFTTNLSTVNRYLNGNVGFIDFGERLFQFFNKLLKERVQSVA